ncbi:Hypothetical protein Tpal_1528 [Trichococcus palustris]|jgi:phage replication-related protein YjqB (UPF0714/DUF867 family)|uniref:Phage-related replication protein n=1 Tax=Trichococcus palustris TaxID=140314 RepID=A0A143YNI1_9LACT|nr:poly-gamma-glutamate hydrolase family protein [Trichococcus palustris]CZQ92681.1 Hypothetical protein Tpal_1528 [Trichococcus palustris]SFL05868.1 Phage-related replication protein YjqB, UPF0714/DUF867 family [Trichococcus palustris]
MKKSSPIIAFLALLFFFAFAASQYGTVSAAPHYMESTTTDSYANYSELAAAKVEGVDYDILHRDTTSKVAVIAIHGGGIEPGTGELADDIAGMIYDFYAFDGKMSSNNMSLHIEATNFDEPIALALVQNSERTLSIHGFTCSARITYVSGLDKVLVGKVKKILKAAGFKVADAPQELAGISALNICNKNIPKAGVQIEVSSAQRSKFFASMDRIGRETTTPAFVAYTDAIEMALAGY